MQVKYQLAIPHCSQEPAPWSFYNQLPKLCNQSSSSPRPHHLILYPPKTTQATPFMPQRWDQMDPNFTPLLNHFRMIKPWCPLPRLGWFHPIKEVPVSCPNWLKTDPTDTRVFLFWWWPIGINICQSAGQFQIIYYCF